MLNGQQPPFDLNIAIPMFISWFVIIIIAFYLILKGKTSTKLLIVLYLVTSILGGIILGAIPNAVMPIQQIFAGIGAGGPISAILPMIIILAILLLSTLLFGRIFCGFACPVGAIQELLSKINFKSDQKGPKYKLPKLLISSKLAFVIRWTFFGIFLVLLLVWTVSLLQLINPFLGFSFIRNPAAIAFLFPLITLLVVIITSIFVYRPWCRILCPFGAIASLTGRFSLFKYKRNDECTECGLCEQICPTKEAYEDSKKGECYLCARCVDICPVNAIHFKK